MLVSAIAYRDGRPVGTHLWHVDRGTLKFNEPIPVARFQVAIWPCDDVVEFETGKMRKPTDPNWSPQGHADFPWDRVIQVLQQAEASGVRIAPSARVPGSPPPSAAATPAAPSPTATPAIAAPAYERITWWMLPAGIALLAGAIVYWFWSRRKPT